MKLRFIMCLFLMQFAGNGYAADIPDDVTLTAAETSIDVEWTGDSDADGYYVYWGTASDELDNRATLDDSETSYTITDLDAETKYYVAVSSYEDGDESDQSTVESATTLSEDDVPSVPDGLSVTSLDDITQTSVGLEWDENTESDLDFYNIYYDTTSDGYGNVAEADDTDHDDFTVSDLTSATRYYFAVSAVDTSDNESDKSENLIVDMLPDSLPPFEPDDIDAVLSDVDSIAVSITDANEQMADFAGTILYYGETAGDPDFSVDLGSEFTYTLDDLPVGTTWFFSASSYDSNGNESSTTYEVGVTVEEAVSFLNSTDEFEGGCFIGNAIGRKKGCVMVLFSVMATCFIPATRLIRKRWMLLMLPVAMSSVIFSATADAETNDIAGSNIIGASAGYYMPNQAEFEDYYDGNAYAVFGFYERFLSNHFSAGVTSGYMAKTGDILTITGEKTSIGTKLTLIPVSASIKYNVEIADHITGYLGAGPDYWYCREETEGMGYPEISEWVGGCHGTAGLRFYSADEKYSGIGFLLESSYSKVDRFGANQIDIGGWFFKAGFFRQF